MGFYSKISLSKSRKDLKYLIDNYGYVYDYCGGFCNTERMIFILLGSKTIKETIIDNILAYFTKGTEDYYGNRTGATPDRQDKVVQEIIDRYGID